MHIRIATDAGACFGVNRALDMVQKLSQTTHGSIHTLGPLIHNPTVVSKLAKQGVQPIASADEVAGDALVLRTHGVTPDEEARAYKSHSVVIDATCPFVIRAHKAAQTFEREGYQVLVFGEKGHPEVIATLGYAKNSICVECPEDLDTITLKRKVGVVVQTTQTRERLRAVIAALVGRVDELRLIDTICGATTKRQRACASLSAQVDCMLVIGGKMSANTCHLAEIAAEYCAQVHHIERASELEPSWFTPSSTVGITAGASTPQYQIDEVVAALHTLDSELAATATAHNPAPDTTLTCVTNAPTGKNVAR